MTATRPICFTSDVTTSDCSTGGAVTETQQPDLALDAAARSVANEVARLQQQLEAQRASLPERGRELDAARKVEARAWNAFVKGGEKVHTPKHATWLDAFAAMQRAESAYERAFDGIRSTEERIDRVKSSRELDRRTTTYGRINQMAAKTAAKKTAKDLGVPAEYLSESGSFRPGMDARLKSDLILAILEQDAPNALVPWTREAAVKLFAKFPQWKGFLDRKREILASKAEAQAAKAAEKAQAEKDKAAAKKTAPAEAEAVESGEAVQVTPDPKPTRKPRASRSAKK